MFRFWKKLEDWEIWWKGYWHGLHGNISEEQGRADKKYWDADLLIYNDGWDEGIEDRGKLNKFIGK